MQCQICEQPTRDKIKLKPFFGATWVRDICGHCFKKINRRADQITGGRPTHNKVLQQQIRGFIRELLKEQLSRPKSTDRQLLPPQTHDFMVITHLGTKEAMDLHKQRVARGRRLKAND